MLAGGAGFSTARAWLIGLESGDYITGTDKIPLIIWVRTLWGVDFTHGATFLCKPPEDSLGPRAHSEEEAAPPCSKPAGYTWTVSAAD